MLKRIIAFLLSLSLCLSAVFISAAAVESGSEAIKPDGVKISFRCGVLKGESVQLQATLSPENALMSSVEWSSSKPNVISCTPDGLITGKAAGGYADITCKAKWGNAYDKIRVYCVEPIDEYVKSDFVGLITPVYAQPDIGKTVTMHFNTTFFIRYIMDILAVYFKYINAVPLGVGSSPDLAGGKCEIRGKYKSYAYIFIETENGERDGFVKHTKLEAQTNMFLTLSAEDIDVWGNKYVNPNKKLTTPYKGEVKWTVSDDSIIDFNHETGQIKGLKPGTATITATAGNEQKTCTVHSLYRWPQTWTTATNQETYLYRAKGSGYVEAISMPKGRSFTVYGDNGTSDGWAYGVTTIGGEDYWGYIPISHVSTKGTISQYNRFNIGYPIKDVNIRYISSAYGKRSSTDLHRGFDITGGDSYIYGKELVSPFNGEVVYVNKYCYNNNKSPSQGYCITIESNGGKYPETAIKDSVTNECFTATFMHLSEAPSYVVGDFVKSGDVVGKIGNTGNVRGNDGVNPAGTHLHFEMNNMAGIIGSNYRDGFAYNINPIFFYMDRNFGFNTGSSSYINHDGAYWYGND